MRRWLFFVSAIVSVLGGFPGANTAWGKDFSGAEAMAFTGKAVAFGPRPSGSPALASLRATILTQLKTCGCEVTADRFGANTPDGPVQMENIIARFPAKPAGSRAARAIVVTGHYDTLKSPQFVGANDGGSSAGFLLELAAVLQGQPRADDVYLVFFDGEEAVRKWTDTDSLYGSRHLADKWLHDGTVTRLKALINVDMIGDKNLKIMKDGNSVASVRDLIWQIAGSLGYSAAFSTADQAVEDDHIPFVRAGVRAVDLIDFESQSTFWHTPQDTMDKLSAHSFEVVGNVVVKAIAELEQQK